MIIELDPSGNPMPGAQPPGPAWLRKLLGDDLFVNVMRVVLFRAIQKSPTPGWNTSRD